MVSDKRAPRETVQKAERADAFEAAIEAHRAGHLDEAETVYHRILASRPDDFEVRHMLGIAQLQKGRVEDALASFQDAIAGNPTEARYHNNLGDALMRLGQPAAAHSAFERSLALDPELFMALSNRGNAHMALHRFEAAERDFRAVLEREPANRQALTNLGAICLRQRRLGEAVGWFRQGLEKLPSDAGLLTNLATALEMQNDLSGAAQAAQQALDADPAAVGPQYLLARLDHRSGRFAEARSRLESLLAQDLTQAQAIDAWFELGLVLDRSGAVEDALKAIDKGNALARESPAARNAQGARFLQRVEVNRAWFTAERLRSGSRVVRDDGRRPPVFFVGFPRSGTTLVERVLAAHPEVITTAEISPLAPLLRPYLRSGNYPDVLSGLTAGDLNRERERFWTLAEERHGALQNRVLVDKMPLNIVDLGFINLLFSDSPVVVALRDPRDVCLSCYMQRFKMNDAMVSFLDLSETVRSYRAVMELWLHYRGALTLSWMEYRYEDLVEAFEATLREVLRFIGLEWCAEMDRYRELAKAETIRTPSYRDVTSEVYDRAVGRWRAYEAQIAPQFEALAPLVSAFGYPLD